MIVTIHGTNYEGAHFRGFASDTDDVQVMINITGSENAIARYVLENFSYGTDEKLTISQLVDDYKRHRTPQWDGCGGVVRIAVDGKEVFLVDDDYGFAPTDKWLDLGTVDADSFDDPFNDVNDRVRKAVFGK